jgi:acetylornithine deacetylase
MGLIAIGADFEKQALSDRFDPPYSTIHVGTIAGGTARNIMARDCQFHWEFRGLPGVDLRAAYDRFTKLCDEVAARRFAGFADCSITTEIEVEVPALAPEAGSAAETLAFRLAQANAAIAVPFATEAGQFQQHGLPTIVCGPGDIAQAHQPDEYIEFSQISACLAALRRLAQALS